MNYFIFNKDMDYRRGTAVNLHIEGGRLSVENPEPGRPGMFLSRVLDSREKENRWHRLVMEAELGDNMAVYMDLYATDSQTEVRRIESRRQELKEAWEQAGTGGLYPQEALQVLDSVKRLSARNPRDILLHQVQGRYLWISMTLYGNGSGSPVIHRLQVDFPKETWLEYLPEIYQGEKGEFLERYLSIFQSVYDDMGRKIRHSAAYMDIQAASPEFLLWLSRWISTGSSHLWRPERLKEYLKEGASVYKRLGTPQALVRIVEIYTGFTPYLAEPGPGGNPHLFCLYIPEEAVASPREYQALLRIIREGKPADMEVQVIALKPFVFLDQDTYLGINSVINEYGEGVLDGGSSIPYAVLGGREE